MGNFIPVEPEKWAEMVKALALVAEMDKTINASQAECRRLKAEVERLTHLANQSEFYRSQLQKDTCRLDNIQMQDAFKHYEAENARLKAEVERLRFAGDMLAFALAHGDRMEYGCASDPIEEYLDRKEIKEWNEAKEGKQP